MLRKMVCSLYLLVSFAGLASAQTASKWRSATTAELENLLPARAPVEKERIETEMRTATGIINEKHQAVAAVVLITAGYAADGKYSHFFLSQVPLKIGNHLSLTPGTYCVGWTRGERGLLVHFFDAATGVDRGAEVAEPATQRGRIESFRIVPPSEHPDIQIGRFLLHYSLE